MSYTEFHTGKLRKIDYDRNGMTLEQWCQSICNGEKLQYDSWLEQVKSNHYEKYFFNKDNEVYELYDHKESSDNDYFCKLIRISDNEFSLVSSFDNGGTCLSEMIEEELEKL